MADTRRPVQGGGIVIDRRRILVVVLALSAALVACGSPDADPAAAPSTSGDMASSSTDTAGTSSTVSTETTPSSTPADGGDIEGSWVSEAQTLLDANTANLEAPMIECEGLIQIAFTDGRMKQAGDVDCSIPGQEISGHGVIDAQANYTVSGDHLSITDSVHDTQLSLGGMPGSTLTFLGDGDATYSIANDVLTIEFFSPVAGTISQTWLRD